MPAEPNEAPAGDLPRSWWRLVNTPFFHKVSVQCLVRPRHCNANDLTEFIFCWGETVKQPDQECINVNQDEFSNTQVCESKNRFRMSSKQLRQMQSRIWRFQKKQHEIVVEDRYLLKNKNPSWKWYCTTLIAAFRGRSKRISVWDPVYSDHNPCFLKKKKKLPYTYKRGK